MNAQKVLEMLKRCKTAIEALIDIDYHLQGMGCGLEDRGITDRYEAMRYGWDEAIESAIELFPPVDEIEAALSSQLEAVSVPSVEELEAIYLCGRLDFEPDLSDVDNLNVSALVSAYNRAGMDAIHNYLTSHTAVSREVNCLGCIDAQIGKCYGARPHTCGIKQSDGYPSAPKSDDWTLVDDTAASREVASTQVQDGDN